MPILITERTFERLLASSLVAVIEVVAKLVASLVMDALLPYFLTALNT